MPWVRAVLKGQKVFAKAKADGSLLVEGGTVAVCYKATDGRVYRARAANLSVEDAPLLPDDACTPGEDAPPLAGAKKPAQKRAGAHGGQHFTEPAHDETAAIAYADGACSGNPGPAGLGVVVLDDGVRTEISEYLGDATNNIAELAAIDRVLDAVADPARRIVIHTDSGYAIGVLAKGWKAKANVAQIAALKKRLAERSVRFVHVRGHAGIPLNEKADELARDAVQTRGSRRQVVK